MKAKYFILGALAVMLLACEQNFFSTESPSAMDEAVFKSADLTAQAVGAIYNTFFHARVKHCCFHFVNVDFQSFVLKVRCYS